MTHATPSNRKAPSRWLLAPGAALGWLLLATSCNVVSGLDDLAFECGTSLVPSTDPCPEVCNNGCLDNDDICSLNCDAPNLSYSPSMPWCGGKAIVCPAGKDCRVTCRTPGDCVDATIHCPDDYQCQVSCAGRNACLGAVVLCSGSGPCLMVCESLQPPHDGPACDGTNVVCGSNTCEAICLPDGGKPAVVCGDACACTICE